MKKFIFMLFAMLTMAISTNAQTQSNYAGSSKFLDNTSVTMQVGAVTPFNDFMHKGSADAVVLVGVDKFVTPWLGFGAEGRTAIGVGNRFNSHTAFDAVNVSGNVKFNVLNAISYKGDRRTFEPVLYAGIGWGHLTTGGMKLANLDAMPVGKAHDNFVTKRAGVELYANLGKQKNVALVLNIANVWGDVNNFKLAKSHGKFEGTIGLTYRFKTSRTCPKGVNTAMALPRLWEEPATVAPTEVVKEVPVEVVKEVVKEVTTTSTVEKTYVVAFAQGKSVLTDDAKATLDKVTGTVAVTATASPEGGKVFNQKLSEKRATAVKEYLEARGVKVTSAEGKGVMGVASNRIAVVTVE